MGPCGKRQRWVGGGEGRYGMPGLPTCTILPPSSLLESSRCLAWPISCRISSMAQRSSSGCALLHTRTTSMHLVASHSAKLRSPRRHPAETSLVQRRSTPSCCRTLRADASGSTSANTCE